MEIKTIVTVGDKVYRVNADTFELHEEKMASMQRFVEYEPDEPDSSALYHQGVDDSLTENE